MKLFRLLLEQGGVVAMGRGRGGYTHHQLSYKDSSGRKVKDKGAIFVAERYMDMGYESVFRQEINGEKRFDLTIKTSDDVNFVKNIEVKQVISPNSSRIAENIRHGFEQLASEGGGTIALYDANHNQSLERLSFIQKGIDEAKRKGWVKGPIEVWFKDKIKVNLN